MEIRVKSTADHYDRTTGEDVYSSREAALQAYRELGAALGMEIPPCVPTREKRRYVVINDEILRKVKSFCEADPAITWEELAKKTGVSASSLAHRRDVQIIRSRILAESQHASSILYR